MKLFFNCPHFVDYIKAGKKVHTIRRDLDNKWTEGTEVEFWYDNKKGSAKSHCFGKALVSKTLAIDIFPHHNRIQIDGFILPTVYMHFFAYADGFDGWDEMKEYFYDHDHFKGKLILWDELEIYEEIETDETR